MAVVAGLALASLAATPFGFFGFIVAYGIGRGGGELVLRAAGRYRGQTTGAIAAAGALGGYLLPFALEPLIYGDRYSARFGVIEVVLGAVAGLLRLPPGRIAWPMSRPSGPRGAADRGPAASPAASSARRWCSAAGAAGCPRRACAPSRARRASASRPARRLPKRRPAAAPEGDDGR